MNFSNEHQGSVVDLSAVIPVFNEEANLEELYRRLTAVLGILGGSYEIIFVDDASADRSRKIIEHLCSQNAKVKGVLFAKNFGQHVAITAGLDHAQGKAVILMDADLQDPPESIEEMYKKFQEGYDIVCAVRECRGDPFYRGIAAKMFYAVFRLVSRVNIPPDSGVFRIISRRVVEKLNTCPQRHRFITGWISALGFSQAVVRIKRDARHGGKTQYNFLKLFRLAFGGLTSCSSFAMTERNPDQETQGPVYTVEKFINIRGIG